MRATYFPFKKNAGTESTFSEVNDCAKLTASLMVLSVNSSQITFINPEINIIQTLTHQSTMIIPY